MASKAKKLSALAALKAKRDGAPLPTVSIQPFEQCKTLASPA